MSDDVRLLTLLVVELTLMDIAPLSIVDMTIDDFRLGTTGEVAFTSNALFDKFESKDVSIGGGLTTANAYMSVLSQVKEKIVRFSDACSIHSHKVNVEGPDTFFKITSAKYENE